MGTWIVLCALLATGLAAAPAAAQTAAPAGEAEALRRDLEQMRQQFDAVRQEYQKAIDAMSERLRRLEAGPRGAGLPPAGPTPPAVAQTPTAQPAPPTLTDYLRPREPFALTPRTGRGQLLFDIGVAADFIANLTSRRIEDAALGTFAGRENRIFPREIELSLFGQIDPYARGEVRLEAGEEFEDGERELHVGLAEAHLTLLTLPLGTQAKLGLMRTRFGLLNERHAHDLPQPDRPNVLVHFFGDEGLVESGAELSWVPPLPFYLELLAGVFNGDTEPAFGRGSLRRPLATGRARTFVDLGPAGAIQLGASVARGFTEEDTRQTFAGYDVKYRFTPEGWRHSLFTLASEGVWSWRRVEVEDEIEVDTDGDGVPDAVEDVTRRRTRDRFGWYVYGEVQPFRRWAGGVRYDSTQYLEASGREWAVQPYLAFMPSEFLRFRLAYKRTEGTRRPSADEVFLQATFLLGAHPAHPF